MSAPRDVVVDDHLLVRILLDDEPTDLRPAGGRILTTGLWYHRFCRAVVVPAVAGTLSRSLGSADPELGAAAIRAVVDLPDTIDLVSLRDLAWPMAGLLADGVRLNLLSLEALAAAEHADADLCLAPADDNRPLRSAAEARGTIVRTVEG